MYVLKLCLYFSFGYFELSNYFPYDIITGDEVEFGGCFSLDHLYMHLNQKHGNLSYICGICSKSIERNRIEKHLEEHKFFEFLCVHCKELKFEVNAEAMRLHMADQHPNQFLFVASRRIKDKVVDLSYPTNTDKLYKICKYQEKQNDSDQNLVVMNETELNKTELTINWRKEPKEKDAISYDAYLKYIDRNSMGSVKQEEEGDN